MRNLLLIIATLVFNNDNVSEAIVRAFRRDKNIIQQLLRSHNATSAEGERMITRTQTTGTLANNASGKGRDN